jgi:twitching motility protein PilT
MQIDELLKLMVNKGASDLHLTVPSPPVLRIDGVLTPQEDLPPMTARDVELALQRVATERTQEETRIRPAVLR